MLQCISMRCSYLMHRPHRTVVRPVWPVRVGHTGYTEMLDGVSRCDQLFDLNDCAVCGCESGPWNYRLFVPKTFRSHERIIPMGNIRSRDLSFQELLFSGPFVPRAFFSFPETFVPNINFSLDLWFSWYRPSVRCRQKNTDSSSKSNFLRRRRKKLGRIDVNAAASSLKKKSRNFQ